MSTRCSKLSCDRRSQGLCYGCRKAFCSEHMIEHNLSIQAEINPLNDRVRIIDDRIRKLNQEDLLRVPMETLENWRIQSHQMIDVFYAGKIQQLNEYVGQRLDKCSDDLHRMKTDLNHISSLQDVTHENVNELLINVEKLESHLSSVEQNDFQLQIDRLNITENLIRFGDQFNMSNLSPAYRSINRDPSSSPCLATDGRYLLLNRKDRLVFVDDQLNQYETVHWPYEPINGMCYSSTLKGFIIITENEVFHLDQDRLKINKIRSIPWQQWSACTCSRSTLYLTTSVYSSSVMEFTFLPSIHFAKRWRIDEIAEKDETIDDIVYKNRTLAMLISNDFKKAIRFELRSVPTMEQIWSLALYLIYNPSELYRFCSISKDEWLIADHIEGQILHISNEGKFISTSPYRPAPLALIEFSSNTLAISSSKKLYLHKF